METQQKLIMSALKLASEMRIVDKIPVILFLEKKGMLGEQETEILWSQIEAIREAIQKMDNELDSIMAKAMIKGVA